MAELEMNLYDYSKQIVSQMNPLDPLEFNAQMIAFSNYMAKNKYSMLYCKDLNDFTIFTAKDEIPCPRNYSKELSETIANRGFIVAVEEQSDGAWEIWIRDNITNEDHAYYLFDYTTGVVEV